MQTNEKTTFVSFLLDETGSMHSIRDDTIGGFNTYVETLQREGADVLFSLVSFNSNETKRRYVAEPISNVAALTADDYVPAAATPLIDAAVKIINATAEAVDRRDGDPNVVVVMQTDGLENVSVEYDNRHLAKLIKEKTAAGWDFVFLGAGLDAFAAAREAGIMVDARRVLSYDRKRSKETFSTIAARHARYSSLGLKADLDFTPEQRAEVGDVHTQKYLGEKRRKKPKKGSWFGRAKRRTSTTDDYTL